VRQALYFSDHGCDATVGVDFRYVWLSARDLREVYTDRDGTEGARRSTEHLASFT